jgi:hypothetical protein
MDTVILKVYGPKKFKINHLDWFLPVINSRKYDELTPQEQQQPLNRSYLRTFRLDVPLGGKYLPRVRVMEVLDRKHKDVKYVMEITVSIPKLLYGNSVLEVSDADFKKVLGALQYALSRAGIEISQRTLADARLTTVHLCKNIFLPKNLPLHHIIKELSLVDITKVIDVTDREIKNGGHVFHLYSGVVGRVFYDKVADCMRPKNKRMDKGYVDQEREIIDEYWLHSTEIFRYEYRLKKTVTVERVINKMLEREPKSYTVFRDIFTAGIQKKMLLQSWHEVVDRAENQLALIGPVDRYQLLEHIVENAKASGYAHSKNNVLIAYGIANIIHDHGAKLFKRLMQSNWDAEHPERLNKKIAVAAELAKGLPFAGGVAFIDVELHKYELITRQTLDKRNR